MESEVETAKLNIESATDDLSRAHNDVIAELFDQLRVLQSGKMRIGESCVGGPWVDATKHQIAWLSESISRHKRILAKLNGLRR